MGKLSIIRYQLATFPSWKNLPKTTGEKMHFFSGLNLLGIFCCLSVVFTHGKYKRNKNKENLTYIHLSNISTIKFIKWDTASKK